MEFLSLKDKLEEFGYSYGAAEKLKCSAKICGVLVANTAILAGKVAKGVLERQKEIIESKR